MRSAPPRCPSGSRTAAGGDQIALERLEVVDLAVVGDDAAAIGAPHRLGAARQIDDRQPAMTEAHVALRQDRAVVGPAMLQQHVPCSTARTTSGPAGPVSAIDTRRCHT